MGKVHLAVIMAAVGAAVGFASHASAATLTVTSITTNKLSDVNTVTNAVTDVPGFNPINSIDSLIFVPNGSGGFNIAYDWESEKTIRLFNTTTLADTVIVTNSFWSTDLQDMALEPGAATLLVSDHDDPNNNTQNGGIYRVNITTGLTTQLVVGRGYTGIAYNPADPLHFYAANLTNHTFGEFNAATGALIKSISTPAGIDGLTFDSFTGLFWGAEKFGPLVSISPDLNTLTSYFTGQFNDVDGIAADGLGFLYLVQRSNGVGPQVPTNGAPQILDINVTGATPVITLGPPIPGLDDLAPASGLGSRTPSSPVPLPASVWTGLSMMAGLGIMAMIRRRKLAVATTR